MTITHQRLPVIASAAKPSSALLRRWMASSAAPPRNDGKRTFRNQDNQP